MHPDGMLSIFFSDQDNTAAESGFEPGSVLKIWKIWKIFRSEQSSQLTKTLNPKPPTPNPKPKTLISSKIFQWKIWKISLVS